MKVGGSCGRYRKNFFCQLKNHPDLYTWNLEINHFKGFMGRWQAVPGKMFTFGGCWQEVNLKKNGDELWPKRTKLHQVYVKHWVDLCLTSGSLRLMKDPCWFSLDKCWRLASWRMLPTVTSEWTTKTLHHVGTWISLLKSCHLGVIIPVAPYNQTVRNSHPSGELREQWKSLMFEKKNMNKFSLPWWC